MRSKRHPFLALIMLIFLGTYAGQCGSNSGAPAGSNTAGTGSGGGLDQKGSTPSGADASDGCASCFDGFEAMARLYNKKPEELKDMAQTAGFDPKDFDPASLDDLAAFLNFIHIANPGLYVIFQGSDSLGTSILGLLNIYLADTNNLPYADQERFLVFARSLKAATVFIQDWHNQVSALASLFGFSFPAFDPLLTPYPNSFELQKTDLMTKLSTAFAAGLLTPEVETAISDMANQIFSQKHLSLNGLIYELVLESSNDQFTQAKIEVLN